MSSIRPPSLGPIVGHTTSNSCRLWIRAADPGDNDANLDENRRTIGVITVLKDNDEPDPGDTKRTYYFRLHREYDRTGTFNLGKEKGLNRDGDMFALTPDTTYKVRMGTLALDDAFDNDQIVCDEELTRRLPDPCVWAEELCKLPKENSEAEFRTFPEGMLNDLSFILGSCRYPGLFWKKKHADRIFGPILNHIKNNPYGNDPRFVLMIGDQIYADMFHRTVPIGITDTNQEFQDRYHEAFGSRNMRQLLRNIPAYMILDDHEIEDNWHQDRIIDRKKRVLFQLAIGAYMSYQWSHGPRNFDGRLFYHFECGGFPFFVLDERTQRYKDDEPCLDDNHLLGRPSIDPENEPTQLDHLCNWLTVQQNTYNERPKFIVSPTVFVPNPVVTIKSDKQKNNSDAWPAFPKTRKSLLNHIINKNIQNVVFLSGDIHCSNVAEIEFSGSAAASKLKAFSITSSAFYWPFWFADGEPSDYVHDSKDKRQLDTFVINESEGTIMDYKARNFIQKDNFCQVNVDWQNKKILVRAIGQKGELMCESTLDLNTPNA
ncbi:MAG: alkaline phosphatase family protein [Candidatus Brocadiaceae bacterium]|nr:alkaline phosphatase family protein [Candidatus Brocadiaceae bacterium]